MRGARPGSGTRSRGQPELIEAIMVRMAERGDLVPEIIPFEGRPLVRRITWANRFDRGRSGQ